MWLYSVEACDTCWHRELSKSLLTPPCGWRLRSSHSSVSGAAADQPVDLKTKMTVTRTHHISDAHWLGEDSTAACPVQLVLGSSSGLVLVSGPLMGFSRESFLNKCSQHYFLHPVWLHFSPKSNEDQSLSLFSLVCRMKCLYSLETWQE